MQSESRVRCHRMQSATMSMFAISRRLLSLVVVVVFRLLCAVFFVVVVVGDVSRTMPPNEERDNVDVHLSELFSNKITVGADCKVERKREMQTLAEETRKNNNNNKMKKKKKKKEITFDVCSGMSRCKHNTTDADAFDIRPSSGDICRPRRAPSLRVYMVLVVVVRFAMSLCHSTASSRLIAFLSLLVSLSSFSLSCCCCCCWDDWKHHPAIVCRQQQHYRHRPPQQQQQQLTLSSLDRSRTLTTSSLVWIASMFDGLY